MWQVYVEPEFVLFLRTIASLPFWIAGKWAFHRIFRKSGSKSDHIDRQNEQDPAIQVLKSDKNPKQIILTQDIIPALRLDRSCLGHWAHLNS